MVVISIRNNILVHFRVALRHLSSMDSKEVLRRLESRAIEAQKLIKSLKHQIAVLTQANNGASVDKECKDLCLENEKLEKEIEVWKTKLTTAETVNGKIPVRVNVSTAEKPCGEQRLNGEVHEVSTDVKISPPTKKSAGDQEKPSKKKNTDKKQKQDAKRDIAAEKLDDQIDVGRLDIRIGRIVEVNKHPDADSLYVESVELGEEKQRTVVSGLVRFIERQELEGRLVALLCNLKPAKMRGVTSEAMVLCASTPEKVEVLNPPLGSAPGDIVICEGYEHRPDSVLNPKKKVWETVAADLKVSASGVATYKGVPLTVSGKGEVRAKSLTDVPIK
ncbi:aminoacyl tRNA synthase complex-interacting multifunctional protein 1 [Hetaerina americana]|uniref:aminoacyl tRNA synthase complex-interacting multifunctional protein 1 n=1 Tax=Hetaerina americana TaxID=62018 RepID=UPI003A7F5057